MKGLPQTLSSELLGVKSGVSEKNDRCQLPVDMDTTNGTLRAALFDQREAENRRQTVH